MDRFDWGEPKAAEIATDTTEKPKLEEKQEPKKEPEKKPEEKAKVDEEAKKDEKGDDHDPEESEEVKGLKASAFKYREKLRKERAEKQALLEENEKLKAAKDLKVEDFDDFEAFEAAKAEINKKHASADPLVIDAAATLNKKFEKAGFDVEEMAEALSEMEHLPAKVLATLADRKDGALVAKWLAENEDSEEAQSALYALTDIGIMRSLDDIAELIKAKPAKKEPNKAKSVETITRLPGGNSVNTPLEKLGTEEFIETRKNSGPNRFW